MTSDTATPREEPRAHDCRPARRFLTLAITHGWTVTWDPDPLGALPTPQRPTVSVSASRDGRSVLVSWHHDGTAWRYRHGMDHIRYPGPAFQRRPVGALAARAIIESVEAMR